MKKNKQMHKLNYMMFFGISRGDFIPCTVCGTEGVDIHHILYRSQGGLDNIENLIALCRKHHDKAHGIGGKKTEREYLFGKQLERIKNRTRELKEISLSKNR